VSDGLIVAWRDYSLPPTIDFAEYHYTWSALDGDHVILVEQRSIGAGGNSVYGCLLDDVLLTDDTAGTVLFQDGFDDENITRIPKACGSDTISDTTVNVDCTTFAGTCEQDESGVWHFTGYDCDTGCGCAQDTTGAQVPDGQPLSDLESGPVIIPVIYTSSRSYTGTCALGHTGDPVTHSAYATSEISQADADARALAAAQALVEAELVCVAPFDAGDLINIRLWPNAPQTGVSAAQIAADRKAGFGLFGFTHEDFWNQSGVALCNDTSLSGVHQPIYKSNGELTDVTFLNLSDPGNANTFIRLNHPEPIMRWSALFGTSGNYIYKIDNLPNGTYALAMFGHSDRDDGGGIFEASNGSTTYPEIELTENTDWRSATIEQPTHCAYWRPVEVTNGYLTVTAKVNWAAQTLLGAVQLLRLT
jgi:hypothetical protein